MQMQNTDVPIAGIYFSHSRIRPRFSGNGRSLSATLADLATGACAPSSLPRVTIVALSSGRLVSLSNRRLHVFKELLRAHPARLPGGTVRALLRPATAQEEKRLGGPLSLRASLLRA